MRGNTQEGIALSMEVNMTRKFFYTFTGEEMSKFRHCPRCGSKFMSLYEGDYHGMVQCYECPEDECTIDFTLSYKDEEEENLMKYLLENGRTMTREEHRAHYEALMKMSKPTGRNLFDSMGWEKNGQDTSNKKSD
jgi:hypothetical protein